ncbi:MAG: insecticidal toxin complex protein [Deltaproteobacteria bacterium HGW-Deltaproteobacteria-1]|jgi:RHS repeat-associated protein|nr:MAG: insecticidal toxin complex protein [Deltaproteobacteria bacterium HGW-Deltaproteobacteria-1]
MKKEIEKKSPSAEFLKTDKGKSKSIELEIPYLSLPKGGGAIRGIDEKFSVNPVNGTASFSVPLPFSKTRYSSPSLNLSYNSGAGNGPFGLGWDAGLVSIKRKTDRELPLYFDDIDSDTYVFSGAEDLVPEFARADDGSFMKDSDGDYIKHEVDSADHTCRIRYYRPRIEGLFSRIERWTEKASGIIKWRILTKENTTTLFGWLDGSRISDPDDEAKTFQWFPEFVFDDRGNCHRYLYQKEDDAGFNSGHPENRNRKKNGKITYANLYLQKILYGNRTPYFTFGSPFPAESDYMYGTVFDYGEYDSASPYNMTGQWGFRPDAFADYKAGFEIRTTRLCQRVLLFHNLSELPGERALVKSLDFEYDASTEQGFTFLKSVTQRGYLKKPDGSYTSKHLPPMEFDYQKHDWNSDVNSISRENLANAPAGLDEQQYHFTDLYGEGLSGIFTEAAGGWYYKRNQGHGHFEPAKPVLLRPSFEGGSKKIQLADLDADGTRQMVVNGNGISGYFELDDNAEWMPFRSFVSIPNINLADPSSRMVDLNGDGKPDILSVDENFLTWYSSEGRNGYAEVRRSVKPHDEEAGPGAVFSDSDYGVFLADMSGDGLSDIVRIRNGEVSYWPNLGHGRFGARVLMGRSPVFDRADAFNPAYIRLADIDGSGTADIIYLGRNAFTCWLNQSGNAFAETPFTIEHFPEIDQRAKISVTDLMGNGVSCLVWSSDLAKYSEAPLKYVDLMNGKKPHIMMAYKNNIGKEVSIEYTPSTDFYIKDKLAGRPWISKLHFPVQCVSKITTVDAITGHTSASLYQYHHGYYDHAEREFRGFGLVEQTDAEDCENWDLDAGGTLIDAALHQRSVTTRTWNHTGVFSGRDRILNIFEHEYWYSEMSRQGFPVSANEAALPDARLVALPGLDPSLVEMLSPEEWREALRACRGMELHAEVFVKDAPAAGATQDQLIKQLKPYKATSHGYTIELVQPKGQNRHAVFFARERENITYNYERNIEDPRVAHNLNLVFDEYGNACETASVVYPRGTVDLSLPPVIRDAQNRTMILYTQSGYTQDVISDDVYRLRMPSEVLTYDLSGVSKAGPIFSAEDFKGILAQADQALYSEIDRKPSGGKPLKRLIEHQRNLYYKNDLTGPLPLNTLESNAIIYESYQLAYTPDLLAEIFGGKVTDAVMTEGKYVHSEGDGNWWGRSGRAAYIQGSETVADAKMRFYMPVIYTDANGASSKIKYYGAYFQFIEEIEDALGGKNKIQQFDFRTLLPRRMIDVNDNVSEIVTDELGLVKALALFGKGSEADDLTGMTDETPSAEQSLIDTFFSAATSSDLTAVGKTLLGHATSRYVYDFGSYKASGRPIAAASIVREEHYAKNNDSPVQISFEYSGGNGKTVMKKLQAEPGPAKQATVHPDGTCTVTTVDTSILHPAQLRWLGNERTVLNNKGNPVLQYEPYFSVTHRYENYQELVEIGVTPFLYYDALDRHVQTVLPDGTLSKTEFDSWKQSIYDSNDTVKDTDWYKNRTGRLIDAQLTAAGKNPAYEKAAADTAALHYDTPTVQHLDVLGRPVLSIEHNKNITTSADEYLSTIVAHDAEGNLRSVSDPRGNTTVMFKYDMLGNRVYQQGMDTGQRWLLMNIFENPLRTWDERNHEFRYEYDILRRPVASRVLDGDGDNPLDNIFDRIYYGEGVSINGKSDRELNLRGQAYRHFDTAGLVETPEFSFKTMSLKNTRKLFANYRDMVNWSQSGLDTAGLSTIPDLETETYTSLFEFDALDRSVRQSAPDGSVILPSYDRTGLLCGESVALPDGGSTVYIRHIDYNEKSQRNSIRYGNDVTTEYSYDRDTFHLIRLQSKRKNGDLLQDWHYTFDPAGNVTHIEDDNAPVAFFNGQMITSLSTYAYDAVYRLVSATGRENNAAVNFSGKDNWNDSAFLTRPVLGDPMVMRNYSQSYEYDNAGNITAMKHAAGSGSWTRNYNYEASNNRLKNTTVGQGANSYPFTYGHHPAHGFITDMPHLEDMGWNFKEELIRSVRQKRNDGGKPVTTYYQYDSKGQRVRKVTDNQAGPGLSPATREERVYIGGYEIYRDRAGSAPGLEQTSLSLMDDTHRFVIIETRNGMNDGTEQSLVRYQLHNHIGTASMELDNTADAAVISYEEYHPFGTTSYQAVNAAIKSAGKRYRFTGMERDEESGLNYHGARYCALWLGRWCSGDPAGLVDGTNLYRYARNNPLKASDPGGMTPPGPERLRLMRELGFDYDARQDIWYSRRDCIQRHFGYLDVYDQAAALAIDIDNETIRFEHGGRHWKIELWKGDYTVIPTIPGYVFGTGAEVGVYVDQLAPGTPPDSATAVNDQQRIRFELYNRSDMAHPIFTRDSASSGGTSDRHWWLTGFSTTRRDSPEDLVMRVTIGFVDRSGNPDPGLARAFYTELTRGGRYRGATITGHEVSFTFDRPYSPQPPRIRRTINREIDRNLRRAEPFLGPIVRRVMPQVAPHARRVIRNVEAHVEPVLRIVNPYVIPAIQGVDRFLGRVTGEVRRPTP